MFEQQTTAAQSALSTIFQPAAGAIDALSQAAEKAVSDLQSQLSAAQATAGSQGELIQQLQAKLATDDAAIIAFQAADAARANTRVWDGLELTPWLLATGTKANTGATGSTASATQQQPGVATALFGIAPNGPFAGLYWYKKLGADPNKKTFKYELSFLMPTAADAADSQAVEFELQQVIAHAVFNIGFQFDFAENAFRVWNRSASSNRWTATGLTAGRWTPGTWMRVVVEAHRDDASVFYDAVTVNGVRSALGQDFPATQEADQPDMLNVAVQLDSNSAGAAYKVCVDDIRFTAS